MSNCKIKTNKQLKQMQSIPETYLWFWVIMRWIIPAIVSVVCTEEWFIPSFATWISILIPVFLVITASSVLWATVVYRGKLTLLSWIAKWYKALIAGFWIIKINKSRWCLRWIRPRPIHCYDATLLLLVNKTNQWVCWSVCKTEKLG